MHKSNISQQVSITSFQKLGIVRPFVTGWPVLQNNRPKCYPNLFFKINTLYVCKYLGKNTLKNWDSSVIKKLPQVSNRPLGKNSSSLVTLVVSN
jgi:hypothetical protein